jgi:hypothetical protein
MSRKLGGSKLTKPYNRQWLTKNPVELLCRLFKCTQGKYAKAEPLFRQVLRILSELGHGTEHEHPHFRTAIENYAELLSAMGWSEAEIRKDARLRLAAPKGQHRFYAAESFTPEQIRQDPNVAWQQCEIYHGGAWRSVRFKELPSLYWPTGAKRRPLRLLVIAPIPYRNHKEGRILYRQPAYLLTTDLSSPANVLIQAYFDRWQIEVNHREEKTTFGVGQAQVRNPLSVPRQPAFSVALYAMLLLAALQAYGPQRTSAYLSLPKWRRNAKRPSCLDIISQLRLEMERNPDKLLDFASAHSPLTHATLRAAA